MKTVEIALGALLHDIGKFFQRARRGDAGLSPQSLGMTSSICPTHKPSGRPTHLHVLYTNEFMENLPFLPGGFDKSRVANLASYHHRPDTPEQEIIAQADRLSSAMERYVSEDDGGQGPQHFRRVRLRSVASRVFSGKAGDLTPTAFPLEPLSPERAFPDDDSKLSDRTPEYGALWDHFIIAWGENRCPSPLGFLARSTAILERYTSCIPSATNVLPDISLFDHLKTTAAIAVCLAEASEQPTEPFLLVAGDLTGIQKYIFDVRQGTGHLARRLRARSFKVATYMESVSLGMLTELGLPITQRILFAGGKFHMLLPNTAMVMERLEKVKGEVGRWLFEQSAGEVGFALAALPAGRDDLRSFSDTVVRLNGLLREARDHAGEGVLLNDGAWTDSRFILPALHFSETEGLCESCQRRNAPQRERRETEAFICDECFAEEQLGRRLPKARHVVFYRDEAGRNRGPVGSFELLGADDKPRGEPLLVLELDGTAEGEARLPIMGAFRGRHIPRHPETGEAMTFEELAQRSAGRQALGCLKMDVDNLGYLFSQGLKEAPLSEAADGESSKPVDRTSISRVATLSRTLDTFFSGYLEWLLRGEFADVYLLYSGGDDLAAVGPWNRIVDLTLRVREDFRRFTAGNPAWTLSAGISVINPRVPVLLAIEEAETLLEASKTAPGTAVCPWPFMGKAADDPQKDRLTAFGTSIPWSRYGPILDRAKTLLSWLQDGAIHTAQVRRLLDYAEMARQFQLTGDTRHLEYAPLLVRDLRRNWEDKTPAQKEARQWAAKLTLPDSEDMKHLRFVCEYALCGNRTLSREE